MNLGLDLDVHGDSAPVAPDRDARLTIGVSSITEHQHLHDTSCDGQVFDDDWTPTDFKDHFDEDFHVGDPPITGFTPGTGAAIATKQLSASKAPDLTENTTITIVHTPQ